MRSSAIFPTEIPESNHVIIESVGAEVGTENVSISNMKVNFIFAAEKGTQKERSKILWSF